MLRLVLIQLILFFLPFAIWFGWRAILVRLKKVSGGTFDERPIQTLMIAGGALFMAGLIYAAFSSGERGEVVYIPAHMADGELVPGRYVPVEEAEGLSRDPKGRGERPDPE